MGAMNQFVGSYNSQKAEITARYRHIVEAKKVKEQEHQDFLTRATEIESLVAQTFFRVGRHLQRSQKSLFKAHETALTLARIGGEDYQAASACLKQAFTGPEAYADACAACLIDVND
jgi:hypothetical protein